jgi:hypothetical protein
MPTDRLRWMKLGLTLAALPLLAGCEHDQLGMGKPASTFGEANRQTMMAQVVDPEPEYEYLDPATSAQKAAQAVERYRTDKVKKPDKVRSTETGS